MWSLIAYYVVIACSTSNGVATCQPVLDLSNPIVIKSNMKEDQCSIAIEIATDAVTNEDHQVQFVCQLQG